MDKTVFSACPIYDRNDLPFSMEDYSKFKYGSRNIARQFGKILAKRFWIQVLRHDPPGDIPIIVYPSPYNFIPTATFVLKDYFIKNLNEYLIEAGCPPLKEGKIYRNGSYLTDYGTMSVEQRDNAMGEDHFHIDSAYAKGKILIFLDDIRVTGSHERRIDRMVKEFKLQNKCYYLYFASVEDPTIDASFENELNLHSIHSLLDIAKIIRNDEFAFNTRVTKYILQSNPEDFKVFVEYQTTGFLDRLLHYAIGNSYHLSDLMSENFQYLSNFLTA